MAILDQAPTSESETAIPHLGMLLRRIRMARGVSPTEITRYCGFPHQTTVDRLEAGRLPRDTAVIGRYIDALAASELVSSELALTPAQASLLMTLHESQGSRQRIQAAAALYTLSFRTILPEYRPPPLAALVRRMEQMPYPALIMDDLWFDHAINGTLCNIFAIPRVRIPGQGQLRLPDFFYTRWEMWHSVGIKFPQDSPLRIGYAATDRYFLPAVLQIFFETPWTLPHLFGRHMHSLLARLRQTAQDEGYRAFSHAWHQVTAFLVPEHSHELLRIITYQGQSLLFRLTIADHVPVTDADGYTVNYALAVWEPDSQQAEAVVQQIADPTIYYAADHDQRHQFHINTWPELQIHPGVLDQRR